MLRMLQQRPEVLGGVLDQLRQENREGVRAAVTLIRRGLLLLFEELEIRGPIVTEVDASVAQWGLDD